MRLDSSVPSGRVADIYLTDDYEKFNDSPLEKIKPDAFNFKRRADASEIVYLRSNLKQQPDEGEPLALFDLDERHPTKGGEIFVSGEIIVAACRNEKVTQALNDGFVIEATREEYEAQQAAFELERPQQIRANVEAKKEEARAKFVAVFHTEVGFEQAWENLVRADTLIGLMRE